jgi:hypothetical protein
LCSLHSVGVSVSNSVSEVLEVVTAADISDCSELTKWLLESYKSEVIKILPLADWSSDGEGCKSNSEDGFEEHFEVLFILKI